MAALFFALRNTGRSSECVAVATEPPLRVIRSSVWVAAQVFERHEASREGLGGAVVVAMARECLCCRTGCAERPDRVDIPPLWKWAYRFGARLSLFDPLAHALL